MNQNTKPPSGGSAIERPVSKLTVTLDWKSSELVQDILDTLQYVTNTTTCEATKSYLMERLDYLTKQ